MRSLLFLALSLAFFPGVANADPITTAIVSVFSALGVTVTAAAVTSFLVNTALSFGLSLLSQALAKRKGTKEENGVRIEGTTVGEDVPQKFPIGRYVTGGHLEFHGSFGLPEGGPPNKWYARVFSLSDVPGVRLRRLMISDEWTELGEVTDPDWGAPILKYRRDGRNWAYLKFYDGTQTAADPLLVEQFGEDPDTPWTADHIGHGVAYAVVLLHVDKKLFTGIPQCKFELDGVPLYDLRKDETVGGSGPHRHDDPSTWEPSENLAVQAYNIFRGIPLPDGSVYGGELAAEDLPFSNWAAGMNECDLEVNGRPQFTGGLEINVDEEPAVYIEELLAAGLGQVSEVGGVFRCRWGSPDTPILAFTDNDVSISDPQKFDPFPGLEETYNAVRITHPSPDHLWEPVQTPAVYNEAWESEDGGRRLPVQMNVPACFDHAQAQQLAKGYAADHRRWRRHTLTLPPDAFDLSALDSVSWTSARNGYVNKIFEVVGISYRPFTLFCDIQLRERDPDDYDWGVEDELPPPPVSIPASPTDRVVNSNEWSFAGVALQDAEGADRRPAVRITLVEDCVEDADALEWRVELVADGSRVSSGTVGAKETVITISDGILSGAQYRAQVRPLMPGPTSWSSWKVATAPMVRFTLGDIDQAALDAIQDDAAVSAAALDDQLVVDRIEPIEAEVGTIQRDLDVRDVQTFHAADALGVIGDQVLWALTKLSDIDSRMAEAGIYTDPETGTVRIYGVEAEAERISEAEIRLSAAEAAITLSATQAWVNQQISNAVLDPSQIPLLDDLQAQINQVEVDLDAAEAAINLKATQTEVDGIETRLSTAEIDIAAAQESISLKVDQADFDDVSSRLSSAEVQISTLDGPAITQTVTDVRAMHDQLAVQDVATLEQLLMAYEQREALKTEIAYATQDIRARMEDESAATAAITASLGVAIDNSVALIEAEKLARASGDDALASSIEALEVRLDGDVAAQATALNALTTRVTDAEGTITSHSQSLISLEARLDTAEGDISGNATAVSQLDSRVTSAEGTITSHSQSLTSLEARLGTAEGDISGNATAVSQLDSRVTSAEGTITSHSQSLTSLEARLDTAEGDISGNATAVSQLDTRVSDAEGEISSQATAITTLQSDVGTNSTNIQQTMQTVDGVMGEYTLRIDNNGRVSGMVLRSDLDNAGKPTSSVAFQADKFAIVSPDGATQASPFVVYTSDRTIGGRVYPEGVYMENVYLGHAAIGRAEIQDVLQSDNYEQDADGNPISGLRLNFNTGRIKAANVILSRPMVLASGSFQPGGTASNGTRWSFVNTGIRVGKDDVWQAQKVALVAAAAVSSTGTAPSGFDPNNAFWCCKAQIMPGARWNGFGGANPDPAAIWRKDPSTLVTPSWASASDQRLFLAIDLEATGGVHFNNPTIEWTVFQVT